MLKLSANLLYVVLPLFALLDAGVLASDEPGAFQTPLDAAPPTPLPPSHRIHPGYNHPDKCVDVQGAVFENGTPVQVYDCNSTPAQDWYLRRGSTKVRVAGPHNFCLDAGDPPFHDGRKTKIWECVNVPAQQWYYTDDDRIALEGTGFCLDLTDGKLDNENPIQIWTCIDDNKNQVWSATL
ncbi:hypothetical protein EST38_g11272 [Candolleomyces aberdarensis]|uniref:Ricin B lectin domain-containing protein n=1 Tax=Candolleomyces aberdarensis TaxID=2316362 RepID=A0A4Q2D7J5_9AGAR|nr:hypothetical protein EST38_g11272 [Candolleomyces aberdarensis]